MTIIVIFQILFFITEISKLINLYKKKEESRLQNIY